LQKKKKKKKGAEPLGGRVCALGDRLDIGDGGIERPAWHWVSNDGGYLGAKEEED
jgi:hypothetical protein